MKKMICLASLLITTGITLSQEHYKQTKLISLDKSNLELLELQKKGDLSFICLIIPSQTAPFSPAVNRMYQNFSDSLSVPSSFFAPNIPQKNTHPTCFLFDWIDKNEGNNNLNNQADELVNALIRLKRDFPKSRYVIIAHGRSGFLVNIATRSNSCPKVDAIVEIGTPIPVTKKAKNFYPQPSKFSQFFNIQTAMPYVFQNPTIHTNEDDQKKYPFIKDFKPHTTRLIINGTQVSLQKDVFASTPKKNGTLLGSTVLLLCQKAASHFGTYRNTWSSIGAKQNTPVLMGILKTQITTQPTKQELARSAFNKKAYEQIYGPLEKGLAVKEGARYRATYRTATTNTSRLKKLTCQTA